MMRDRPNYCQILFSSVVNAFDGNTKADIRYGSAVFNWTIIQNFSDFLLGIKRKVTSGNLTLASQIPEPGEPTTDGLWNGKSAGYS